MSISGQINKRRANNAKALAVFGLAASSADSHSMYKVIRESRRRSATVFTIGYERRTGEDLIASLRDAGIEHLADIRDKPMSRKADFRAASLMARCEQAGIEYGAWTDLGSTKRQRDRLRETGDLQYFHKLFRAYANRSLGESIDRLARVARQQSVALMCYERAHEECHRSTIATLVADRLNAGITAIL